MIAPPPLQPGSRIAIVATARKIGREEVERGARMLEKWGLEVVYGHNLFAEHNQFAGTDEQRAADLQAALDDESVDAVLCARGGYGTVRIIDRLDFTRFRAKPKWIAGYSDITVLHSHIQQQLGIETLHSTMPINFPADGAANTSTESLRKALFGESLRYTIPGHALNRTGTATGELVGGNLSIIYALMGSPSQLDTRGKILFLEDLDEYLYHVDRMMQNLKRSGMLDGLAGLIVGGMSDMNDNAIGFGHTAEEIIQAATASFSFPVCYGFPAGHIADNRTLMMGRKALLSVAETVQLSW